MMTNLVYYRLFSQQFGKIPINDIKLKCDTQRSPKWTLTKQQGNHHDWVVLVLQFLSVQNNDG